MNKIISTIKEYNLIFHTSFIVLLIANIITWGWLFYKFIGAFI
jgi:hypothetical protein